jgi:hypothetical protein
VLLSMTAGTAGSCERDRDLDAPSCEIDDLSDNRGDPSAGPHLTRRSGDMRSRPYKPRGTSCIARCQTHGKSILARRVVRLLIRWRAEIRLVDSL